MKRLFTNFILVFACGLSVLGSFAQNGLAPLPASKNKFVVIAHRGNHVNVPENTLASYEEAIKSGADYVEVDLRTSKDGFLVVQHDDTVDRMTDGTGKVNEKSLAELKKLQVKNSKPTDATENHGRYSE